MEKEQIVSSNDKLQQQRTTEKESNWPCNVETVAAEKLRLNCKAFHCTKCPFVSAHRYLLSRHLHNVHRPNRSLMLSNIEFIDDNQNKVKSKLKEVCGDAANIIEMCDPCTVDENVNAQKTMDIQTSSLQNQMNTSKIVHGNADGSYDKLQSTHHADKTMLASDMPEEYADNNSVNCMYKCNFCGRKFRQLSSLSFHTKVHTRGSRGGKKKYRCKRCGFTSPHGHHVLRHCRQLHAHRGPELESEGGRNGVFRKEQNDVENVTEICETSTGDGTASAENSKNILEKDQTVSSDDEIHQQLTTQKESKWHYSVETSTPRKCQLKCKAKAGLFSCSECSFVSAYRPSLLRHLRNIHRPQIKRGRRSAVLMSSDIELMDDNQNETEDKWTEMCIDAANVMEMCVSCAVDENVGAQNNDFSENIQTSTLQHQVSINKNPNSQESIDSDSCDKFT